MKNLTEHIAEAFGLSMLTESIASQKVRDVFTDKDGKLNYYFTNRYGGTIAREMQWDKLTDADVEEMSTEEARKLAYKKDSDAYILWLDANGKFQARSFGNYMILMDSGLSRWVRNTVKSVSMACDHALVVKDPDKFQTREIRSERTRQKQGALALMSAADVAKQNIERYKDLLRQKQLQEFNMGDVVSQVEAVLKKYAQMVANISSNLVSTNDYKQVTRDLDDIESDLQKIMSVFKRVISRKADYDQYNNEKFQSIIHTYRERLVESADMLSKLIDQFEQKYAIGED